MTAEGLLDAYKLTGATKYLDAAKKTGNYLINQITLPISSTQRQNAYNVVFLYHLSEVSGDVKYLNRANDIMNHILNEVNYYCPDTVTPGCTALELVAGYKTYREFTDINPAGIIVWDLAPYVEAAKTYGNNAFAQNIANEIKNYLDQSNYAGTNDDYELGLSAGIKALSLQSMDYSSYLTKLLAKQDPTNGYFASPNYPNEKVQSTAYAAMTLLKVNSDVNAKNAVDYLTIHFRYSTFDGWLEDGVEYSEVTSEAAQAIFDYLDKTVLIEGIKSGDNYAINYNVNTFTSGEGNKIIPIIAFGSVDVEDFVIIVDNTAPVIGVQEKTPAIAFNINTIQLSAIITDNGVSDGNLDVIQVDYGSGLKLVTLHDHGLNKYMYNVPASTFTDGQNVNYYFYAKDKANNEATGASQLFRVNSRTKLIVDPLTPDGGDGYYKTLPGFTLERDSGLITTKYKWGTSGTVNTYLGPFNFVDPVTGGVEDLHYWSEAGSVVEPEQVLPVKVDIASPEITNENPVEDSIITDSTPLISVEIDDKYQKNSGIDTSSILLTLDGVEKTYSVNVLSDIKIKLTHQVLTDLPVGEHTVVVSVKDKAGNPTTTKTWKFTYEPISVEMNVLSPSPVYYDTKKIRLNIMTDEIPKILLLNIVKTAKDGRDCVLNVTHIIKIKLSKMDIMF